MVPRWGWGRKLIGTDAKTSAEIANHPQNHPPRLRILPPDGFTSGTEHSSSPGFVAPSGVCVAPLSLPQALDAQPRLRAFRSRAGPDGASPPARVLLSNAHVVPRRPPALTIRVAPYPCRASLQGIGGVCFPRPEVAVSAPLRRSVPLQEQVPRSAGLGREQGSLLAAVRIPLIPALLPAWLCIRRE